MLRGIFLIVGAAVCWGLGGVAGQYLFQNYHTDPVWLVMVRQIIAGLLFLGYTLVAEKHNILLILRARPVSVLIFSFVGILGSQLGFYYTISLCNAATSTVLQYTAPVWVMIYMSYRARALPEPRELVGIVGALTGVFLIATHGSLSSLALSPVALVSGLISAVSYAFYCIQPVELLKTYPATVIVGWGQLLSGLSLLCVRQPLAGLESWHADAYFAMGYLIAGATIASYALYLAGLKLVGSTKASLISCAEPLASIIAVVLLLGTRLLLPDYIGMACIIFTVLLLSLPKK